MAVPDGKRLLWVDTMRGIAMLLVVLGHSIGTLTDPVNRFVLSFHMPLFFFISGLVANTRAADGKMKPFGGYLLKKLRLLLIPQLTMFVLTTAVDVVLKHEKLTAALLMKNLFHWFLWVLLFVSVLYWLLDAAKLLRFRWILLPVLFAAAALTQIFPVKTFIHAETVPMALFFYLAGHTLRPLLEARADPAGKPSRIGMLWIGALPLIAALSYWNAPVTMYDNFYGNLAMFFACAALGIFSVYEIAKGLQNDRALRWFGTNSIIIYVFHASMLNALHGAGKILIPALDGLNYTHPYYWCYFVIVCVLFVPVVYICNHWLAFLFGKRNVRRDKGETK